MPCFPFHVDIVIKNDRSVKLDQFISMELLFRLLPANDQTEALAAIMGVYFL